MTPMSPMSPVTLWMTPRTALRTPGKRVKQALAALLIALFSWLPGPARAAEVPRMDYDQLMDYVIEREGTVVLVNFWATWCGPCLKELPSLMHLREEISPERLDIVGVSLDYDPKAVAVFLERKQVNFPNYIASPDLMELLQIRSIPKMLLYDTQGMEVISHEGYVPLEELRPVIEEHLPPASE